MRALCKPLSMPRKPVRSKKREEILLTCHPHPPQKIQIICNAHTVHESLTSQLLRDISLTARTQKLEQSPHLREEDRNVVHFIIYIALIVFLMFYIVEVLSFLWGKKKLRKQGVWIVSSFRNIYFKYLWRFYQPIRFIWKI